VVEDEEPAVADFGGWWARFAQAEAGEAREVLIAEGVERAQARREVMQKLIREEPERALRVAVPERVRAVLPGAVKELLEAPVAGTGDLAVLAALPEPGKESEVEPLWHTASIDGRQYRAHVYGRRLGEPTRRGIPLLGVAIDGDLAVYESPVRVLPAEEAAPILAEAGGADCDVCVTPAPAMEEPVVVQSGSQYRVLCCPEHAAAYSESLVAAESGPPDGASPEGSVEGSAWTEGIKKIILIRVDFSDLVGLSLTESGGATLVSNLHTFYQEMSYGRAGFTLVGQGSAVTPLFRMPNTASYYGSNNAYDQLRADARAAATAAGYRLSDYTHDVVCMGAVPGFGWSGLGYVGSAGSWLRNSFGTGVAGHELGHNFGISHAGFWDTGGKSIIGPGSTIEYGDSFDTMGSASAGNNHFNARYKNVLNWLQPSEMTTVTSSGTYRVYAHDQPMTAGSRGLGIAKNSSISYWLEFRQKFTSNRWLMNGLGIRWTGNGTTRSQLLDTTPGSPDARSDTALVIGRTFADTAAGIYVTPIRKNGTTPESLDVVVNMGGFAGNRAPNTTVTASSAAVATGTLVQFQAAATDADGDPLSYYWDFGNGTFGTNQPSASCSWSTAGDYVVRCTVSDMKGGEASDSILVTVGSPTTYRISGRVTDASGPLHGVRVFASSTRMAYTDSDGTYTITGLPAGSYTLGASLYPLTFGPANFANPLTVAGHVSDIDFLSTTIVAPTITAQPQSQAVAPGSSVTFTVGASGTQPFTYQWRFNGAVIAGATGSSYTRSNVQAADVGNYSVVVTNSAGSATSANAALTVNTPPVILAQPQSRSVLAGTDVTFTVNAGGTAPLSYQWRFNNVAIPGATSASYTRSQVQLDHSGGYSVVVGNAFGSTTSTTAQLTVAFGVTAQATSGGRVTVSPSLSSYPAGTVVTLTAESTSAYAFTGWSGSATGSQNPLTLTVNSNLAITANFASPVPDLVVDNPSATLSGKWTVSTNASNKYGTNFTTVAGTSSTATASATFTANLATSARYDLYVWWPTISKASTKVPVRINHAQGTQSVLLNQTSGAGSWRLLASGVPFQAGTSGSVVIANNVGQGGKTVAADAVRWVYSPNQEATSPQFLNPPQNTTVTQGEDAFFSVTAGGSGPLSYQWYFNGNAIPDATDDTLVLTAVQPEHAGEYSVIIQNALGQLTSPPATLTVLGSPVITSEPIGRAVGVGEQALLSVAVQGADPLTYRWRRDDVDLTDDEHFAGTDSPTLTIQSALPQHAGAYTVIVSNGFGSATSSMAFVSVGFEGDSFPAPYGDNQVTTGDQAYLGEVLTELAEPAGELVFARLDSAPRTTLGDGTLSLADWVQAGRYAAGLDPVTPAGGPASALVAGLAQAAASTAPAMATAVTSASSSAEAFGQSTLKITSQPGASPNEVSVTVELVSSGEANAVAFKIDFDPAVVAYRSVEWLDQTAAPVGTVNTNDASLGRLAVVAGRPAGEAFPEGTHQLLRVHFQVLDPSATTDSPIEIGRLPGLDSLASTDATEVTTTFESTVVAPPPPIPPQIAAVVINPDGDIELTITGSPDQPCVIEVSSDLSEWSSLTTVTTTTDPVTVVDSPAASHFRRFYRVSPTSNE
jgi:hypothetical protein